MGYEKTSDETLNRNFSFLALFVPHSIQLYKWKKINKKLFAFFLMQSNKLSFEETHIFGAFACEMNGNVIPNFFNKRTI